MTTAAEETLAASTCPQWCTGHDLDFGGTLDAVTHSSDYDELPWPADIERGVIGDEVHLMLMQSVNIDDGVPTAVEAMIDVNDCILTVAQTRYLIEKLSVMADIAEQTRFDIREGHDPYRVGVLR